MQILRFDVHSPNMCEFANTIWTSANPNNRSRVNAYVPLYYAETIWISCPDKTCNHIFLDLTTTCIPTKCALQSALTVNMALRTLLTLMHLSHAYSFPVCLQNRPHNWQLQTRRAISGPLIRIIQYVVVMGAGIVFKAFAQAFQQAKNSTYYQHCILPLRA